MRLHSHIKQQIIGLVALILILILTISYSKGDFDFTFIDRPDRNESVKSEASDTSTETTAVQTPNETTGTPENNEQQTQQPVENTETTA